MQIVLKRIAKKKTYTIGRLYILKDEDVKKRTIESVNKCRGLKTVCEVPAEKLNADSYFCDTLEPCWRNLLGVELSPAEENVRLGRVSGKKAQKMKGKTAIPEGTYPVVKFKNWVTSEVLPQIRKTGGYIPVQQGESDEETIRHAEEILRATLKEKENLLKNQQVQIDQQKKLIGEQDTEIRRLNGVVDEQVVCIAKNGENIIQLENQVDHLLPKALYTDNVLNSVSCYTTTQIAKELGITAQELNRQLCALHIQYYQSGQYLLYADYAHMGLAKSRTRYSTLPDPHCDGAQEKLGTAYTHTYLVWTERGRKFIHLLKVKG